MADFYTVLMHDTLFTTFGVYTSTDPLTSWSPVTDSENTLANDIHSLWVYQDGTDLHVVTQEAVGAGPRARVSYHVWNMTTNVWDIKNEFVDDSLADSIANIDLCVTIAVRSDGDVIIGYVAEFFNTPGAFAARRESGSWTTDIAISATMQGIVLVKGSSDRMHFIFKEAGNTLRARTILSDNSLRPAASAVLIHTGIDIQHPLGPGVAYVDGSDTRGRVPFRDDTAGEVSIVEWDSVDEPTFVIQSSVSDNTVEAFNAQALTGLSVCSKTLQLLYVDVTGDDIYRDQNNDDAGWGTDVQEIVSTVTGLSHNVYSNGSDVVAIIYQISGGNLTYAELSCPDSGGSSTGAAGYLGFPF